MRATTWIGALVLFGAAWTVAPAATSAQARVDASVLWESYSFDGALPYGDVSELSLPVSASVPLGTVGELALSTAYVRVKLSLGAGGEALEHVLSGVADTEARLTLDIVRDRLVFIATAAVPTGIESVEGDQQDVLNVLVTDVLGFYTQRLGSGGSVGGGLAGAVQAGRMAFGFAGSYTTFASYQPLVGSGDVTPGGEFRFRGGVEGPVGEDTYLRVAGILGIRGKDQLGDTELPGLGNRFGGYFSLDQGVGSSTLSLYAFDLFRSDPQTGGSVLGTGLPRGNLMAAGARLTIPAGQQVRLTPRVEWRRSDRAADVDASSLVKLGDALRFGADVRMGVAPGMDVVLQGDGLVGSVQSGVADVSGYRVGVTFSVTR